jgi:hypothetical protein
VDTPASEVDLLFMHGTLDALVDIRCSLALKDAILTGWGLTESEVLASDAGHTWTRYENMNGTVFEFLQHEYVGHPYLEGHCYPGSSDLEATEEGQVFGYGCLDEHTFHWGEAALSFFQRHPRGN